MSHTLRSLLVMSFLCLIVGALWLTAWASAADQGQVLFRDDPVATRVVFQLNHPDSSLPDEAQLF
jgi:hypothetical protein